MSYVGFRGNVLLFIVGLAGSLTAAESPLKVIPSDARVVVKFKAPGAAIEKVAAFADQLQSRHGNANPIPAGSWGDWLRSVVVCFRESVGNEADIQRDWWLFSVNPFSDEPSIGLVIPTTNTKATLDAIAPENEGSFAHQTWVIAGSKAAVGAARECISGGKPSIVKEFNEEVRAIFAQGDLAAFIDVEQLTSTTVEELEKFRKQSRLDEFHWILDELPPIDGSFEREFKQLIE